MRDKFHAPLIMLILLMVLLSACERAASTAPNVVATEVMIIPTPTSNPAQILIAQTQTAITLKRATKTPTVLKTESTVSDSTETAPSIVETITPTVDVTANPLKIPTLTRPAIYALQDHEDPYCIARRFNLDIGELLSQNSLTTENIPATGTVLILPATNHRWSSGARTLMFHPTSYTVRNGDTLTQIACLFGDVSPEAIIVANQLSEPVTLVAGQVLSIP